MSERCLSSNTASVDHNKFDKNSNNEMTPVIHAIKKPSDTFVTSTPSIKNTPSRVQVSRNNFNRAISEKKESDEKPLNKQSIQTKTFEIRTREVKTDDKGQYKKHLKSARNLTNSFEYHYKGNHLSSQKVFSTKRKEHGSPKAAKTPSK